MVGRAAMGQWIFSLTYSQPELLDYVWLPVKIGDDPFDDLPGASSRAGQRLGHCGVAEPIALPISRT